MKPDHRLPDNLLVEAERGEPLSRIHEELSDSGVMLACPHADAISSARSSESQLLASGGRSPAEPS
jgi:hypothetical protein